MALPKLDSSGHAPTPRRYEETRLVFVQDFTHRRILGLGQDIQRRQSERIELERQDAMRLAESYVWKEAEVIKVKAIESAMKQAHLDHEKSMGDMLKEMDRRIKEEGLRVEMVMQRLAMEQVMDERRKTKTVVNEAVKEAEEKAEREKQETVSEARSQEQNIKEQALNDAKKKHEENMANLKRDLETKYAREMAAMVNQKDSDREEAVRRAGKDEQEMALAVLHETKSDYEEKLFVLETQIESKLSEISELKQQINDITKSKEKLEKYVTDMTQEFSRALKMMAGFDEDQAHYLMPTVYRGELQST